MNRGKGKYQLKCLKGVTRYWFAWPKAMACVFFLKKLTPGNLPMEGPVHLRETVMYDDVLTSQCGSLRANCFPSLAFYWACGAVRAAVLLGKGDLQVLSQMTSSIDCVP